MTKKHKGGILHRALLCLCVALCMLPGFSWRSARAGDLSRSIGAMTENHPNETTESGAGPGLSNSGAPSGDTVFFPPDGEPAHTPSEGNEIDDPDNLPPDETQLLTMAVGEYGSITVEAGQMFHIAVPVVLNANGQNHPSNRNADSPDVLPFSKDAHFTQYDQEIARLLASVDFTVVWDSPDASPFDVSGMTVMGQIVSNGTNRGYALIDGLGVREDAEPGEYHIPVSVGWRGNMPSAPEHVLNDVIRITVAPPQPKTRAVVWEDGLIVYSFDELRQAVTSGAYQTVYLGYDEINAGVIAYTDGSGIPVSKDLIVDGRDPQTGRTVRLVDYAGEVERQGLYANANNLSVTFRNLLATGQNWYGLLYGNGRSNIDLRFTNVNYTGRQMAHNVGANSTVTFTGCTVLITNVGTGAEHEVAETTGVAFSGTNHIERTGPQINSLFWLKGTGSHTIRVASGASVDLRTTDYMIYTDSSASTALVVDGSLRLTTTGGRGSLTYMDQYVNNLTISAGGSMIVSHQSAARPSLQVKSLSVDGELSVARASAPLPVLRLEVGGSVRFGDGSQIVLDNPGGRLIATYAGAASMTWTARVVNRHAGGALAGVWNNADLSPFTITLTATTGGGRVTATQGLQENNRGAAIDAVELTGQAIALMGDTRLVLDTSALSLDAIYGGQKTVSGTANNGAEIAVVEYEYTAGAGVGLPIQSRKTTSDGRFSLAEIPFDQPIGEKDRRVYAISDNDGLVSYTYRDVLPPIAPTMKIPAQLPFDSVPLSAEDQLIHRSDAGWQIAIEDLEQTVSTLSLYARIDAPLTTSSGDELIGGLVFVQDGQIQPLTADDLLIDRVYAEGTEEKRIIDWRENEGLMVHLSAFQGVADEAYTATITWSLVTGP